VDSATSNRADQIKPNDFSEKAFAVKIVRDDDPEKIFAHKKEFDILMKLQHPQIIRAIEIFSDEFKNQVYQVMEFIEGQEILDEIAETTSYDEAMAQSLFKKVLEGILYLHDNNVCHRDIKPSNILVSHDKTRLVILDFNVAKQVPEGDNFLLYTKTAGTLQFCAPERLEMNCVYNEKVDIWAAGILLFMLLVGNHPFDVNGSIAKLTEQIFRGDKIIAN
jgi:serine/threonine protein kinase